MTAAPRPGSAAAAAADRPPVPVRVGQRSRPTPVCGYLAGLLLMVLLGGCGGHGDDDSATDYGPPAAVQAWRTAVSAAIDTVNAVQADLEAQAVGSSGQATGQNLAAAAVELRPRLQLAAAVLAQVEPPPALAELQLRMLRLVLCRDQALALTEQAWDLERTSSYAQARPLYEAASGQFETARELAQAVNDGLAEVDQALAGTHRRRLVS